MSAGDQPGRLQALGRSSGTNRFARRCCLNTHPLRSARMAKASKPKGFDNLKDPEQYLVADPGGATHQTAEGAEASLTTNQGVIVARSENTLKSGGRGPSDGPRPPHLR